MGTRGSAGQRERRKAARPYSCVVPLPDRVTVPTCIGCGAISQLGTCDRGCSENRLELVDAIDHDAITAIASAARNRANAYRAVTEELANRRPGPQEYEIAYRSLQDSARAALRLYPHDDTQRMPDPDEPAARATTWWCKQCGGIDARNRASESAYGVP